MDITIHPKTLCGTITAVPSKSLAHRVLICAAFSDRITTILCPQSSEDIEATAHCLQELGARILRNAEGYIVYPASEIPKSAILDCGESGSTLRFLLPIVGALGVDATFVMHGRLHRRPLSPLREEMQRMGCALSQPTENTIQCNGKLLPGKYIIDGSVSSQFVTGLLLAAPLLDGPTMIQITGRIESVPYIQMTQHVLSQFGVSAKTMTFNGSVRFCSPGTVFIDGDWSNGAFFCAANSLGSHIDILNLDNTSVQGDSAVVSLLAQLQNFSTISAANTPDLIPILSIVAAANKGAIFTNIERLRTKESDRVDSIAQMIRSLGGHVDISENTMRIFPCNFRNGTIHACGDHRIAMSAAIAATIADGPVKILGADCVSKSYPKFWDDYKNLGGSYEQHIR